MRSSPLHVEYFLLVIFIRSFFGGDNVKAVLN